ncbi:MAG: hypothetical protein ICV62_03500 [Cyanobacteria bacterium Co-bin13]|nr:hypothetical protein [Cyanobacteria bacterium Co-bin13]
MASSSSANSKPSSRVYQPRRHWWRAVGEWLWPILWVALLAGSGILGAWALAWLTQIPPVPNCEEMSRLSSSSDRIYCARTQARSGSPQDLTAAILLTATWPKIHSDYDEAQQVLTEASQKLMFLASRRVQAGDLEGGVELASNIPQGTPLRKPAQAAIYEWRQEWSAGETLETTLANAIQTRRWDTAQENLQNLKLLKSDFWLRDRFQYWEQQLQREQRSWTRLTAARELAAKGKPEHYLEAITVARRVDLGSRVWAEAEKEIDRWGEILLAYAMVQWKSGNLEAAVNAAQKVPPKPDRGPEAQILIKFAHAQQLASSAIPKNAASAPTYAELFSLREAIRAVEQIPADSPLYQQAQTFRQDWQAHLADASQLQLAQTLARMGQGQAYQLAIAQARTVEPNRPRRIQAQTLIAQWQKELERIADRPILERSDQLARPGTIAALEQAIAEASQIELGRALRPDAQSRIADWRQEIQFIEDRPLIDEAVALAEKNQLREAIEAAQKVQPERALYARAQSLIADWTRTLQVREDQPILDEAKDLAYQGNLSAAIALASQIGPGRALYGEARRAVALWEAERNYIWSIWEADSEASSEEPADDYELE